MHLVGFIKIILLIECYSLIHVAFTLEVLLHYEFD